MIDDLPTLKGLRAFEAVYQLNSYTKAAKTLNVQQPAISYQIKRLEDDLGVQLFDRMNGQLVPTADAVMLFETVARSFTSIRDTSLNIRRRNERPSMTIATYPGIATYWLTSRVTKLAEKLETKTRIVTLVKDSDLLQEKADCWIVFGNGEWQGFEAKKLIGEEVSPIASPVVAERLKSITDGILPSDIVIIDQEDTEHRWLNWDGWLKQYPVSGYLQGQRITVSDHGLALHMAMTGAGITLGWLGLVNDLLDSKSLVRISDKSIASDAGYWILGRPGFFESPVGKMIYKILSGS